jgi:phosphate transport system permease protein
VIDSDGQPGRPLSTQEEGARAARRRGTLRRVRIADRSAALTITIGGLGVIVAVLGMLAFLAAEVVPLFSRGEVSLRLSGNVAIEGEPLFGCTDEYIGLSTVVLRTGEAVTFELATGTVVDRTPLSPDGAKLSSWAFSRGNGAFAIGYEDGRLQTGVLSYEASFVPADEQTDELRAMLLGERRAAGRGYIERVQVDQFRKVEPSITVRDPTTIDHGSGAIVALDYRLSASSQWLVATREDGTAVFNLVRVTTPLGGGKPRMRFSSYPFTLVLPDGRDEPDWTFLTGDGSHVLMLWTDGAVQRYAILRDGEGDYTAVAADTARLTARDGTSSVRVTSASMILGSKTMVVGLDDGRTIGLFVARDEAAYTPDRRRLVTAHEHDLALAGARRIVSMGIGQRDRSYVAADDQGRLFVRNMTSGKVIVDLNEPGSSAATFVDITPKNDGLVAMFEGGTYRVWDMDPKHSEASWSALFGRVWYEGDAEPDFVYQSSAGDDAAEPKLSVTPLIFGTLKATIYAMLFAVPLAVLAAIFTSEMLHPTVRNRVKPVIEAMASLPSVVLGFVAAMVIAPLATQWLDTIMASFIVVPFAVLIAAHAWQMLPIRMTSRLRSFHHMMLVAASVGIGFAAAVPIGSAAERLLFRPSESDVLVLAGSFTPVADELRPAWIGNRTILDDKLSRRLRTEGLYFRDGQVVKATGSLTDPAIASVVRANRLDQADFRLWLDGVIGSPFPGWFILMIPPGAAIAFFLKSRLVEPLVHRSQKLRFGFPAAAAEMAMLMIVAAGSLLIAMAFAGVLTSIGSDARDWVFGPFNQRNSLIVGVIMGFAVIPIIYTVSEDALSSVSPALRSASLGAGATRWQTAIRVVMPVAASGIFSAIMIGLGRAAGETMIVLMATGNTPSMDWSMFSGFRTLSANIATELPEAPVGGTHYRVLFLCGLVLFAMTAVVNTIAELVRQRFRKRAAGL